MIDDPKTRIYDAAVEILANWGYQADVREDYSGRIMYGDTTAAIVTEAHGPMVGAAIILAADENPARHVPGRQDSMGRSSAAYY